ncbi:MAG: hypothetical protein GTO03_07165 [Planctomycetales bacterium]|nr:hypothetical protein [Planctomycetales bacterium]
MVSRRAPSATWQAAVGPRRQTARPWPTHLPARAPLVPPTLAMNYQALVTILPCHSLHDFPHHLEGAEAQAILAAYTALWHPALIAAIGHTPTWRPTDVGQHAWDGCLVLLPLVCQEDLPGFWLDEVRSQGATVIEGGRLSRAELVEQALAACDQPSSPTDPQLVADFLALGLCHLLTETLAVQMRYSSILDAGRFESLLVAAAQAAVAADAETARENLAACFDALAEAKDHFYPVDAYLIDLILVAPTTLGPPLAEELRTAAAANLLISGNDLATMGQQHPESLAALRDAVQEGRISIVGGEPCDDLPLPLETVDGIVDHLLAGQAVYQAHLDRSPKIYGRRRQGLSPVLPGLLKNCGFAAALHFTLDGSRWPTARQSKFPWEGVDGTALEAFGRGPHDAARAASVLALPLHLAESMDTDHVATLCFAHWPGETSLWYRELKRACRFTSALGKFVTWTEFFDETADVDDHQHFTPDDYRTTSLRDQAALPGVAAAGGPISACLGRQRQQARVRCRETLRAMAALVGASATMPVGDPTAPSPVAQPPVATGSAEGAELEGVLRAFVEALPDGDGPPVPGYLAVNPFSFARQIALETPRLDRPPRIGGAIREAYQVEGRRQVVVQLPPLGYAWIAGGEGETWTVPQSKPLQEGNLLRNEHLEVQLDPRTGGIQAIHALGHRGNILSQQLAMRLPGSVATGSPGGQPPRQPPRYATMVARRIEVTDHGPVTAALTSHGHLVDPEGQPLAEFRQTVSLMRTTPLVNLQIELRPSVWPAGDPWKHYYAARFAWADVGAELYRGVALGSHLTTRQRLEAPHYLELRSGPLRTALLTGGVPYHQRIGEAQLDSLLVVPGETANQFQLAVGINLARPQATALEMQVAQPLLSIDRVPPRECSAWLFHLDTTRVLITGVRVLEGIAPRGGVRLRLQEVCGRAVRAGLHAFGNLEGARKVDFLGNPLARLQPVGNVVMIDLRGHEACEVELLWQGGGSQP